jgi:hypothetical protein
VNLDEIAWPTVCSALKKEFLSIEKFIGIPPVYIYLIYKLIVIKDCGECGKLYKMA